MKPLLFALLLSAIQPAAAQNLSAPIPVDPQLTHGTLANGLDYYILHNPRPAAKAELRLVVRAGSLNEADDQRGLAHLLEHMAFNGTAHFPKQTLNDQMQRMGIRGADLNAYTNFNETVYILPIPLTQPDDLKIGLQVLEDWAFHMNLDAADIDQERNVVVEEWRLSAQNPSAQIGQKNMAMILQNSNYPQRTPIGDMDIVRHAPAQRLRDFYHDWYRPNLMSVIVVGDVDVAKTRALIEQKFGNKTNPNPMRSTPSTLIPNNSKPIVGVFTHPDLPHSSVYLFQKNGADNQFERSVDDYVNRLKQQLITQMFNQRLLALQDSTPAIIKADSSSGALIDVAYSKRAYTIGAQVLSGAEAKALRALHFEKQRIIDHGFSQIELDIAKRNFFADIANSYNNRDKVESIDKAEEYIRGAVENESLPSIAWEYETAQKYLSDLQLDDFNPLVKTYFTDNNRIVLINSNQTPNLNEAQINDIINSKPSTKVFNVTQTSTDVLLKDTPTAGRIISTAFDPALDLTRWQLSNGVTVRLKKTDFNNDQINFTSYLDGGSSQITDDVWRKTKWAYDGLDEAGINGHSKIALNQILAGRLIKMKLDMNEDSHGFSGQFTPQNSETALQLIYSQITGLNYNPAAFARYVQRGINSTQNLERDRMSAFSDYLSRQINQKNPRFTGTYPNLEAWKSTDYDAAYQTYQQMFKNANGMQFIFVGKIDEQQFKPWVETYLASLPSDLSVQSHYKDSGYRSDVNGQQIEFKNGHENLSMVYIGINGQTQYNAKEALALRAAGDILSIKLTEHLREMQGGVYSINAKGNLRARPYGEYSFTIQFPCAPDKADLLIKSARAQLDELVQKGPSATDVAKFKKSAQVALQERLKTNDFWVNALQSHLKRGINPQEILQEQTRLLSLSAADIQTVAQKYLAVTPGVAVLRPE